MAYLSLLCAASQHNDATHGELLMPGFSHDQLTRFLASDWSSDELLLLAARAEGVDWNSGWFCLDDTTGEKPYGPCIEGVDTVYSAKHDRYARGITVVTLIWTDGTRTIPLGFRVWHQDGGPQPYRSKLDLAKDLLRGAKRAGIWVSMIVFDSWYAAADFMHWCDRWPVERVYAETKDHLGFARCQARKLRSQEHHIACVLVAYVLLQDPTGQRSIEGVKHGVQWPLFKMKPSIHPVLDSLTA